MSADTRPPPYGKRLDPATREIRVFLGRSEAWRRARIEAEAGLRRAFVMEPGTAYTLDMVRGKPVLIVALDDVTAGAVKDAAIQLIKAGAEHVAAISPSGNYRMFQPEAA